MMRKNFIKNKFIRRKSVKIIKTAVLCNIVLCMALMTGCGIDGNNQNQTKNNVQEQSRSQSQEQSRSQSQPQSQSQNQSQSHAQPQPETKAPKNRTMGVCGIYIYDENNACREFVSDVYESKWESGSDIMCFEVINTHEQTIPGRVFKYMWEPVWFTADDSGQYRIGYCVDFVINNSQNGQKTNVRKMIFEPKDTLEYKEYMEFYLYDDYHQTPGVWYSHVEQNQYDDETLLTSIKFTAGKNVAAIDGEVALTAFIYDPKANQFDAAGNFTGSSKHTITVRNIR